MTYIDSHFMKEFNLVRQQSILLILNANDKLQLSDLKLKCLQDLEFISEYHHLYSKIAEQSQKIQHLHEQLIVIRDTVRPQMFEAVEN